MVVCIGPSSLLYSFERRKAFSALMLQTSYLNLFGSSGSRSILCSSSSGCPSFCIMFVTFYLRFLGILFLFWVSLISYSL